MSLFHGKCLLCQVGLRPSEKEVVEMINSVDMNNDGVLSFCEFVKLMSRQHNPFITPREQFEAVFRFSYETINYVLTRFSYETVNYIVVHIN